MSITVSSIISEYGAYYENSGQNKKRLFNLLMQPTETEKHMTGIKTDNTIYRMANGVITSVLQPFHKTFSAKGDLTFTPNAIELGHAKVDVSLYPDDIEDTWLGFLADNNLSRKEWPLVRYMIEEYLIPKIKDDIELKAVYDGVKAAAPGSGTAGDPEDVWDGLRKQLYTGITSGKVNDYTSDVGTLQAATIFDQVETFVDKISNVYKNVKMGVFMSPSWYRAYMRDKRSQGFYQLSGDKQVGNNIDFTPQSVIALPSMEGHDEIFATPKANLLRVTKKGANAYKFRIEEAKREVAIMTDWWEAPGFGLFEAVFAAGSFTGSGSN